MRGEVKNTRLRNFARSLRRNSTDAEDGLWRLLRDRRFVGYKFRRQVPVEGYVADFVCYSARLIVELDGSQHADNERDAVRDNRLETAGFRVLRIWNNELTLNRQGVLEAVWSALAAHPSSALRAPSPARGEGKTVPDGSARGGERDEGTAL